MKLYKRSGSSLWWCDFHIGEKRVRQCTKRPFNDKKGAERYMAVEYERLTNSHQFGIKPEITIGDAFDRVIDSVTGATATSYTLVKRQFLGLDQWAVKDWYSVDKDMHLSKLSDAHIEDMVKHRRKYGHSDNTINVQLRVVKLMWNGCKKRYNVNQDLTFKMREHFEKTRFLSYDEETEIITLLESNRDKVSYDKALDLYLFLVDTGVRLNEALSIEWPDINTSRQNMDVYNPKTGKVSIVPITDRLKVNLERRRNQKTPFMSMDYAVKKLRQVIAKVGNTNERMVNTRGTATIHSLRDTYASRLAMKGMSLHKVSKLLGHSSTTMTRKYAQLETQDVAEEARRMMNG